MFGLSAISPTSFASFNGASSSASSMENSAASSGAQMGAVGSELKGLQKVIDQSIKFSFSTFA